MDAYNVEIVGPKSVLIGSTVNFTATLYDDGKIAANDDYRFSWSDDTNPKHNAVSKQSNKLYRRELLQVMQYLTISDFCFEYILKESNIFTLLSVLLIEVLELNVCNICFYILSLR